MRKLFFTLAAFQILLLLSSFRAEAAEPVKLLYFYTPTCHKCMDIKDKVLPVIEERFGKELTIEYKDVSEPENYLLLFSLKKDRGADEKSVFPVLYAGGKFLDGRDVSKLSADNITLFLRNALDLNVVAVSTTGASDIEKYFAKFSVLAILFKEAGMFKKIVVFITAVVFFIGVTPAFAKDGKGPTPNKEAYEHASDMAKFKRTGDVKNTEVEKAAKKADKEAERAKKEAEKEAKKAKKEAEKAAKQAEKEAKKKQKEMEKETKKAQKKLGR